MKLVYKLKAEDLKKWGEDICSKFEPDDSLTITISTGKESKVAEVLAQAGSIDDASAAEMKQIIDQEFGYKE